jgi:hypothetical protein
MINIKELQLCYESDDDADSLVIYTRYGLHNPDKQLNYKCVLASLPCSDLSDIQDSAYDLVELFTSAPYLFAALHKIMDNVDEDSIVYSIAESALDTINP